jgi:hypothetical protein
MIFPRVSTGYVVPTASTLVKGERDAVLVDALLTKNESRALADGLAGTGKT